MKRLVIGTRKSELALWQAKWVRERLIEAHPGLEVELAETDTAGDRDLATPLPLVDGKGVFTAEIEEGLRDGTIDLAVHSLKDLPTELPEGFEIGAYCMRHDPRDAFLGKDGLVLAVCTGDVVRLSGMVCSLDGGHMVRVERTGTQPERVGREAAEDALARGAADILPAGADRAGV